MLGDKHYPPYDKIKSAKENCYPKDIKITECGVSVELQSLLDHISQRIIYSVPDKQVEKIQSQGFVMYTKYGMDGSSNQQTFPQKLSTDQMQGELEDEDESEDADLSDEAADEVEPKQVVEEGKMSDRTVSMIAMVPLLIHSQENEVLWKMIDHHPRDFVNLLNLNSHTLFTYITYIK